MDKHTNKQTDAHTYQYHDLAVKITQIQNTEMQKYKTHICKNTNYSVVIVVLEVEM